MNERRIYVGAPVRVAGWEVYSDTPHVDVDYVGPLTQLVGIADHSVSILYVNALARIAAGEALTAMAAWHRVLRPGAAFLCTGVDLVAVGAALAANPSFDDQIALTQLLAEQRSHWTSETLSIFLQIAGFTNVRRVEAFNLFQDVSTLQRGERRLSLNVLAEPVT